MLAFEIELELAALDGHSSFAVYKHRELAASRQECEWISTGTLTAATAQGAMQDSRAAVALPKLSNDYVTGAINARKADHTAAVVREVAGPKGCRQPPYFQNFIESISETAV